MAQLPDEKDKHNRIHISSLFHAPTGEEGLRWLEQGNEHQQELADALHRSGMLTRLALYHPSIAGTFPIGIDIPGSDIDVLCEVDDHAHFLPVCTSTYGHLDGFEAYQRHVEGEER